MSESTQNLSQKLANALEFSDIEIPSYIRQNLNKELREYQIKALKHYLMQRKNPSTNHLMFNMATGSGKTLIMAALMLECYARGHKNFIFFVNSNAVLEKTKSNFCDKTSAKYLFANELKINGENVSINALSTLDESKEGAINVYFSTVQGLYSLFTNERENAFSLQDLRDKKLVFLADEAHHLNANTKSEIEDNKGWEGVIKEAFASHKENLLFEFSATIPNERAVKEKYRDKIVFEYALKEFCQNGYSKRISLAKYENSSLQTRFLAALLLSLYRQLVAHKNAIFIKPVVLFKSESIKESKENELKFKDFVQNLQTKEIKGFFANLQNEHLSGENQLLNAFEFFKGEFKDSFETMLESLIKANFAPHYSLNVNDEGEAVKNQILLNSLEEKHNEIRVIFAVDKLNEGWDVLNLFDIVRLSRKKANANTTTKEVQLIGRGARYFPFVLDEKTSQNNDKFKRKFDNDNGNEMRILERLTYHTLNEVEFIERLNAKMKEEGLFDELEEEVVLLTPTKRAKELTNGKFILYFVGNTRYKIDKNFFKPQEKSLLVQQAQSLDVPLFSSRISESEIFNKESKESQMQEARLKKFEKGKIDYSVFLKALNVARLEFDKLQRNFDIQGKREFFELVSNISLQFDKEQDFNRQNQLEIAKFIISKIKERVQNERDFEVSEFKKKEIKMQERVILRQKREIKETPTWLYYDKYTVDSELERDFVNFIEARKESIDKAFKKWIVFRNEGFNEFKIYDNRKDEASYGSGFEPDFIFFGTRFGSKSPFLTVQAVFEVKGEIYQAKDEWKEALLKAISGVYDEGLAKMQVKGFSFFTRENKALGREFVDEFELFVKQR